MTQPVEDVSSLPGKKVSDQSQTPIGEISDIYALDDGFPMWVGLETREGMGDKRTVVIPLARLKDEDGELCVPYSKSHILEGPEVDTAEGISAECDQALRGYYGIGTADQEMWSDNKGYATMISEDGGEAKRVDDPEGLDTPDADKRSDDTRERLHDPGSKEMRQTSPEDMFADANDDEGGGDAKGDEDASGKDAEQSSEQAN